MIRFLSYFTPLVLVTVITSMLLDHNSKLFFQGLQSGEATYTNSLKDNIFIKFENFQATIFNDYEAQFLLGDLYLYGSKDNSFKPNANKATPYFKMCAKHKHPLQSSCIFFTSIAYSSQSNLTQAQQNTYAINWLEKLKTFPKWKAPATCWIHAINTEGDPNKCHNIPTP